MTTPETNPANKPANPAAKPTLLARVRTSISNWIKPGTVGIEGKSANELAEVRTDLAVSRNLMAADRTLMAWIRTSLSLLSFGFTIYKILQGFEEAGGKLHAEQSPRNIGLFLTGLGTFAMVIGTIEYWQTLKELRLLQHLRLARPTLVMALVMSVLGVFMFVSIITKLF